MVFSCMASSLPRGTYLAIAFASLSASCSPSMCPGGRAVFILFYAKMVCGLEATLEVSSLSIHSPCSTGQEEASSSLVLPTPASHVSSLQSRMVRNEIPYFIWTTRRDVLDCRFLSRDQMINHYARAGSFTTKVGSAGQQALQFPTPNPWASTPVPCFPCQ